MRKIFLVLVAVLLIASTAQAVEWQQSMTAENAAQPKGRSIVTDSSVVMRVWYTGTSASAAVGVSPGSVIMLYSDIGAGTSTAVSSVTYTTIGSAVDFINNQAGWHASVGNDAYRAMTSVLMLRENWAAPGDRIDNAFTVDLDCSVARFLSCGVLQSVGKLGRIKEFNTHLESLNQDMTIDIYEGDTSVYHKNIVAANYQSSTALGSSQSTVTFSGKGLTGTKNTPLCLVIGTAGTLDATAPARAQDNVSIIYDYLAE